MGKEDPPLEPETIIGPTIKQEYVVSSSIKNFNNALPYSFLDCYQHHRGKFCSLVTL
jgi:hypothetical protein